MARIDLTNQKFGKWTVIKSVGRLGTGGNLYWECKCDCGTIKNICGSDLRRGKSTCCKSCSKKKEQKEQKIQNININISRSNVIDETNKNYGFLTVIKQVNSNSHGAARWLCQCQCGNQIITTGNLLRGRKIFSCGCKGSKGEGLITKLLQENKIKYQAEYSFPDLLSEKGYPLRFDFAIFKDNKLSHLIEYQGAQHYQCPNYWNDVSEHDKKKKDYCIQNNIPLIEIPYWNFNKINLELLMNY